MFGIGVFNSFRFSGRKAYHKRCVSLLVLHLDNVRMYGCVALHDIR